jgi:hypothetical protein
VVADCGAVSVLRHIEGSTCQHQNANALFKQVLAEYTPQLMDGGIHDELLIFVNWRKAEGRAPTDFSKIYAISSKMNLHQARV